ncbi:MAG: nitroreductase [Rhodothermales bacterium]|nr:nitroreductase [Rhodothermales bacterium]
MPDAPLPSPDATAALLRSRRTIHLFDPERPPDAPVLRALELARWAPNHRLTEPWRFYLLGPETAARVVDLNARLVAERRGAAAGRAKRERWGAIPGWLALTCRTSDDPLRAREDYAACACALQNLQLYLWSEGIGTKWTTGPVTRADAFYRLLGIDREAEAVVGLVWYGYAADVPAPPRRPLDDVLTRLP